MINAERARDSHRQGGKVNTGTHSVGPQEAGRTMEWLQRDQPVLLRELIRAVRRYQRGAELAREIDEQLAALVVHMEMCFADEDAHMEAVAWANRHAHRTQHRRALWRAREALLDWLRRRDSARLLDYLQRQLPTWASAHGRVMDEPCAQALRVAGADARVAS